MRLSDNLHQSPPPPPPAFIVERTFDNWTAQEEGDEITEVPPLAKSDSFVALLNQPSGLFGLETITNMVPSDQSLPIVKAEHVVEFTDLKLRGPADMRKRAGTHDGEMPYPLERFPSLGMNLEDFCAAEMKNSEQTLMSSDRALHNLMDHYPSRSRGVSLDHYPSTSDRSLLMGSDGTHGSEMLSRKRVSGSFDQAGELSPLTSRKRPSGSVDEHFIPPFEPSPALLAAQQQRRASLAGEFDDRFGSRNKLEVIQEAINQAMETDDLYDGFLFAMSRPSSPSSSFPNPLFREASSDNLELSELYDMSPAQLFEVLKNPDKETLSLSKMRTAMSLLLRIPKEKVPQKILEETFNACDQSGTGTVTMDKFVEALTRREDELKVQFSQMDRDGDGEITIEELRAAKRDGLIDASEFELQLVLDKMDDLSLGVQDEFARDRKIQYSEFRMMMILLPPATSIKTVVEFVRNRLNE
jgi:Ca2+-binding EF-hand superfamily protein